MYTLSARTRREFDEWVRIFSIIVRMNKYGFQVAEKNPYIFENQQLNQKKLDMSHFESNEQQLENKFYNS